MFKQLHAYFFAPEPINTIDSTVIKMAHAERKEDDAKHRKEIQVQVAHLERVGWFDAWGKVCRASRAEKTLYPTLAWSEKMTPASR